MECESHGEQVVSSTCKQASRSRILSVTRRRTDAERLLMQHESGTFLVRESETSPGNYSLSVRSQTGILYVFFPPSCPHDVNGVARNNMS